MWDETWNKAHTVQHVVYRSFVYAISVNLSGHRGGRRASGMLSKVAFQICLEDLLAMRLWKSLLAHEIRSRSIG